MDKKKALQYLDGGSKGTPVSLNSPLPEARMEYGAGLENFQDVLGRNINTERDNLRQMRYDSQGELSKAANAIIGGVASGVLTAVEDISYIADVDNNVKRIAGLEEAESNWLADLMKEGKEAIDEAMPIYKKDPNSIWDWNDSSSYWSALKGVLDSAVGFAIPGMGATKAVGALQKTARLNKYVAFLTAGKKTQQTINSVGAGYITNFGESKMMGVELFENAVEQGKRDFYQQVFDEIQGRDVNMDPTRVAELANAEYQRLLPSKLKEIERNAGDEADKFMLRNKAFMVSDIIGLHGLYKGQGITRGLVKDPSAKTMVKNMGKLNADNLLLQGAKESAEEIGQNILQMEGQYQALEKSGIDTDDPEKLYDRILKYGTSEQALLEGAMGFFGGGPQRVFTKALTGGYSKKGREEEKKRYEAQQWMMSKEAKQDKDGKFNTEWFLKNKFNEFSELQKLREKAINSGKKEDIEKMLEKQAFLKMVDSHFQEGTTQHLERSLKDVAKMSDEQAQAAGFDEGHREKANDMLKELNRMEKSYSKYTKYENQEDVFLNRESRKMAKDQLEYIDQKLEQISNELESNPDPELKGLTKWYEGLKTQTEAHINQLDNTYEKITSPEAQQAIRKAKREIKRMSQKVKQQQKADKAKKKSQAKKAKKAAEVKNRKKEKESEPNIPNENDVPGTSNTESRTESPTNPSPKKGANETGATSKNSGSNKQTNQAEDTTTGAADQKSGSSVLGNVAGAQDNKPDGDNSPVSPVNVDEAQSQKEANEEREVQNEDNRQSGRDQQDKKDPGGFTEETAKETAEALQRAYDALLGLQPKTEEDSNRPDGVKVVYSGANKFAYLSKEYSDNGKKRVEADDSLNADGAPGSISLLDLQKMLPGTKIVLRVADNDDTLVYHDGQRIPWGELKAKLKKELSEEYYRRAYEAMVPIEITDENGTPVAFVHAASWINEDKVYGDVKKDRTRLLAIRAAVVDEGVLNTTVSEKNPGHLFKYKEGKRSVAEAFPDSKLTYFLNRGNNQDVIGIMPENLVNKKDLRKGITYAVLPVHYKKGEGGTQYLAVPVSNIKLNGDYGKKVSTTIRKAIEVWLAGDSITEEQEKLADYISDKMGINITSGAGLEKFISSFLHNTAINGYDALVVGKHDKERVGYLNKSENRGKSNVTLMSMNNNHLEFARANGAGHIFINSGIDKAKQAKFFQQLEARIQEMYSSVFREAMKDNTGVVYIDAENNTSYSTMQEYIGEAMESDVYSVNISQDPDNPHYVYTTQPVIRFDDSFAEPYDAKGDDIVESTPIETTAEDEFEKAKQDFREGNGPNGTHTRDPFETLHVLEDLLKKHGVSDEKAAEAIVPVYNNVAVEYETLMQLAESQRAKGDEKGLAETVASLDKMYAEFEKVIKELINKYGKKIDETVKTQSAAPNYENAGEFAGMDMEDDYSYDFDWGTAEQKEKVQQSADRVVIKELGAVRQQQLVKHFATIVLQKIFKAEQDGNEATVSLSEEMKEKLDSVKKALAAFKEYHQEAVKNGEELEAAKLEKNINALEAIVKNWKMIYDLVKGQVKMFDTVANDVDQEQHQKDSNEQENWADHSAFTTDQKDKLTPQIRKFLAFTEAFTEQGTRKKNFLGQPAFEEFDKIYNILQRLTAGRRPDFKTLIEVLEAHKDTHKFISGLIERLKDASPQVKNQFTVAMTNHYIEMRFIMLKRSKDGKLTLVDSNSNASAIVKTIIEQWKQNLESSEGVLPEVGTGELFITEQMRKQIISDIEEIEGDLAINKEVTAERVKGVLFAMGIEVSDKTLNDIMEGNFHYSKMHTLKDHFTNGLFKFIANDLKKREGLPLSRRNILDETVIKRLAFHEANYSQNALSNSHRTGTKTVYSYGLNKYMINRFRELKEVQQSEDNDGNTVTVSPLGTRLSKLSFNKESFWLKRMAVLDSKGNYQYAKNGMLIIDPKSSMYQNLDVWYTSLEAIKQERSPNSDNGELHKLSEFDNELYRIGQLRASRTDASGNSEKIVGLLYPTTSDKTTVMGMYAPEVKLDWTRKGEVKDSTSRTALIYDALIAPEVERILAIQKAKNSGEDLNNKEMEQGGTKFLMLPQLNNIPGMFQNGELNYDITNFDSQLRKNVDKLIVEYLNELITEKINLWNKFGIGIRDDNGNLSFLDSEYLSSLSSSVDTKFLRRAAATDMVMQYLIGNAEMMKMFIGDPANFYKNVDKDVKSRLKLEMDENNLTEQEINEMDHEETYEHYSVEDKVSMSEETFINMGKRLAGDIGPGKEIPGAYDETIRYLMLEEMELPSKALKHLEKIFGKGSPQVKAYSGINTTDAQEYTTWQEHLHIMYSMGIISGKEHKRLYSALSKGKRLTTADLKLVMTPMKPVYVNNVADPSGLYERRVYIKSSSFPLLPQLTKGLELDKLRKLMEDPKNNIQRAAFMSAVKVGGVSTPYTLISKDANFKEGDISQAVLEVPRSGFRIQQDIPYKANKKEISRVTQASKNLFTNMLSLSGFSFEGEDGLTGQELEKHYLKHNETIFKIFAEKLNREMTSDGQLNLKKVRALLINEAKQRGYAISDQELLELDEELKFFMLSPSANKYESLLNSIVSNRIVKWTMPGKSFVQGAPEGFKVWEDEKDKLDTSDIIFTEHWDGDELQSDQILIPFKFVDGKSKLKLKDFLTDGKLDTEKLSPELLEIFGLRIPNQGPNSQRLLKIAGFLPDEMGDLAIVPRDVVVQMGSDFDVDKLYTYMYHTQYKDGKLTRFSLDGDASMMNRYYRGELADKFYSYGLLSESALEDEKLIDTHVVRRINEYERTGILTVNEDGSHTIGSDTYTSQENFYDYVTEKIKAEMKSHFESREDQTETLEEVLDAASQDDQVKHAQNKIIDVYFSIHRNQNDEVQRIINSPLDEWKLKSMADKIVSLRRQRQAGGKKNLFTGMSDNYQRSKFINATAGKAGIGVFSLDSMFNALVQGKSIKVKTPMGAPPFDVTFGRRSSRDSGDLSNPKALDNKTYKSDVISGYQSASVDNEKLQILDKLNINATTFPVIKILNQLGFLEEVPLFISQDIIVDFIEELNLMRSKSKGFVSGAEEKAYEAVLNRYSSQVQGGDAAWEASTDSPSIERMEEMLKDGPNGGDVYFATQVRLLRKFMDLTVEGRKIAAVQAAINTDSSGIAKSFIESEAKYEYCGRLEKLFINGSRLLFDETGEATSINGLATRYGLATAVKMYRRFNLAGHRGVKTTSQHIAALATKEVETSSDEAKHRAKVWNAVKSYLFTTRGLGLTEEDVDLERERLFIDRFRLKVTEKNGKTEKGVESVQMSLASIIEELKSHPVLKDNAFVQRLTTQIKKDGTPSLIKFNASARDDWDAHNLYVHFVDMIVNNKAIGPVAGVYYDTRSLAEDLIKYSYFSGGVQQAIQFIKYIPPSYLYSIPFAEKLSSFDFDNDEMFSSSDWYKSPSQLPEFVIQYFQHNPYEVAVNGEFNVIEKPKTKKEAPEKISFSFVDVEMIVEDESGGVRSVPRPLVSIEHTGGKNNKALYKAVTSANGRVIYQKISTRGHFGMDEYKNTGKHNEYIESISKKGTGIVPRQQPTSVPTETASKSVKAQATETTRMDKILGSADKQLDAAAVLNSIINNEELSAYNRAIAKELLEVIAGLPSIRVTRDYLGIGVLGRFSGRDDSIKFTTDMSIVNKLTDNQIAEVVLHEFGHAPTAMYAALWENAVVKNRSHLFAPSQLTILDGMTQEQKLALKRLYSLYVELKQRLDEGDPNLPETLRGKLRSSNRITDNKKNYWRGSFAEFITEVLSSEELRKILNETPYYNKKTWGQKIRELLLDLFEALGFDFKKDSALKAAMGDILFLLDEAKEGNIARPTEVKSRAPGLLGSVKGSKKFHLNYDKLNEYKQQYNLC